MDKIEDKKAANGTGGADNLGWNAEEEHAALRIIRLGATNMPQRALLFITYS